MNSVPTSVKKPNAVSPMPGWSVETATKYDVPVEMLWKPVVAR